MEEMDYLFEEEDGNIEEENEVPRVLLVRKYIRDAENPLEFFSEDQFRKRYRFSKNVTTNVLLPIINNDLEKANRRGLPVLPILQLLIALRFYASNSFQIVHGDLRSFNQSTISRIVRRVSTSFARQLRNYVRFPANANELRENTFRFFNIGNFPNVSGCIDGTHIRIANPGGDNAEVFRNRKGWMSLNVQVVAGPRLEILDIVARYPGSTHDSRIYNRSAVQARFRRNDIPGLLLGDSGYACSNKLLTPFLAPQHLHEENYNVAHIRTRNVVERLFGLWKRRFFCLTGTLRTKLDTTMAIICATAVLYNIGREHDNFILEADDDEEPFPNPNNVAHAPGGLLFRQAFARAHF